MVEVVITALGPDRVGIVDELTGELLTLEANVADSRMMHLGGQFAVILMAQVQEEKARTLSERLAEVGRRMGLAMQVVPTLGVKGTTRPSVPYKLKISAIDQPGIVHRITHLLHQQQVNIEELETRLEAGSYSGTPLFTLELAMSVPANVPVKGLRTQVEQLCESLNCDAEWERA